VARMRTNVFCCCCSGCQVVLYTSEDVVERVKELTGGKGVKVVFDGGGLLDCQWPVP
jgi:NADPH:quinone reductase-like Zn-dependent oxidoreductase